MSAVVANQTLHDFEDAQDEEVEETTVPIEKLQTMGISATDVKKLREEGIVTVGLVVNSNKKVMLRIKGMSETKVDKIVDAAKKLSKKGQAGSWQTATQLLEEREKSIYRLTTGCKEFDDMLGGGVETCSITEVFGEFRTGKTQFCHTLAVVSQLGRDEGGGMGRAAYIDTEGSFRPERIKQIAGRFNLDAETVCQNIITARITATDQFEQALMGLVAVFQDEGPFRLLIVDSIMALFRTDYEARRAADDIRRLLDPRGRGELSERQQKLNILLATLKRIAEEFNVAVVLTNQVMADPGGMTFAGADNRKAVGGHVLSHAVTHRVYLKKGKGENRIAKLQCSPTMAEGECQFSIGGGGVEGARD